MEVRLPAAALNTGPKPAAVKTATAGAELREAKSAEASKRGLIERAGKDGKSVDQPKSKATKTANKGTSAARGGSRAGRSARTSDSSGSSSQPAAPKGNHPPANGSFNKYSKANNGVVNSAARFAGSAGHARGAQRLPEKIPAKDSLEGATAGTDWRVDWREHKPRSGKSSGKRVTGAFQPRTRFASVEYFRRHVQWHHFLPYFSSGEIGSSAGLFREMPITHVMTRYKRLSETPTHLLRLAKKMGIKRIVRFQPDELRQIIFNRLLDPYVAKYDSRPRKVVIAPRADYNTAFTNVTGDSGKYRLLYFEAKDEREAEAALIKATQHGKGSVLTVGGHGDGVSIQLGAYSAWDEVNETLNPFQRAPSKSLRRGSRFWKVVNAKMLAGAIVHLRSCSAAKPLKTYTRSKSIRISNVLEAASRSARKLYVMGIDRDGSSTPRTEMKSGRLYMEVCPANRERVVVRRTDIGLKNKSARGSCGIAYPVPKPRSARSKPIAMARALFRALKSSNKDVRIAAAYELLTFHPDDLGEPRSAADKARIQRAKKELRILKHKCVALIRRPSGNRKIDAGVLAQLLIGSGGVVGDDHLKGVVAKIGNSLLPMLAAVIKHDPREEYRRQALEAAMAVGTKQAYPVIVEALADGIHWKNLRRSRIYLKAERFLHKRKDALPALRAGLHSPRAKVRLWSAFALIRIYKPSLRAVNLVMKHGDAKMKSKAVSLMLASIYDLATGERQVRHPTSVIPMLKKILRLLTDPRTKSRVQQELIKQQGLVRAELENGAA